ncbi:MAG: methyltransferase domain-containing protein [Thermodesulfobacteriota bacterium]|nr:methyltransferase domain-containing protein [Thermodesulfobacteriota bacterium]
MDLKETAILDKNIADHWYYNSKAKAMMCLVKKANVSTILDIGAGSGFFSRYLLKMTSAKEAWCVDINYLDDHDVYESGKKVYLRRNIDSVKADLVLLMDILEHVDDDVSLLRNITKKVPNGNLFLISVPAFKFLWSSHDVYLEHKRRYRLPEIEQVIEKAGLKLQNS